jgi:hypothetical protein
MPKHEARNIVTEGYQPKAVITKTVQGKSVQIPLAKIAIKPPQGGTGAVTPKNK